MSVVREIFAILIHHGIRSSLLVGVGLAVGMLIGLLLVLLLHRRWYRQEATLEQEVRPQPPSGLLSGKFVRGLCWAMWLVCLPALLGLAGGSVGGAFALRGLLEDPRPLEGGVDLAMAGSRMALEPAVRARQEGVGSSELELALGFVDGSDRFDIEAVPSRLESFSDEAVVRALASVDEFLMADDEPDPLIRWLAVNVADRMAKWPVSAASGRWLDPVLEQLRERDEQAMGDGRTTGPDVVLAISRHYGQRPFAAGLFWGVVIEALVVVGFAAALVLFPMFVVYVAGRVA